MAKGRTGESPGGGLVVFKLSVKLQLRGLVAGDKALIEPTNRR